jgi:hypothetical protein
MCANSRSRSTRGTSTFHTCANVAARLAAKEVTPGLPRRLNTAITRLGKVWAGPSSIRGSGAEQQSHDAQPQFHRIGRLDQVIIRACVEAPPLLLDTRSGSEENNGDTRGKWADTQSPAGFIPIHARHHNVGGDQIWRSLYRLSQSLPPIAGDLDVVSLSGERFLDQPN